MPKKTKIDPATLESERTVRKPKTAEDRFACLLDENVWRFELNVDFKGDPKSLAAQARRYANAHGKVCEHRMDGVNLLMWYRPATLADVTHTSKILKKWFEENGHDLSDPTDSVSDEELAAHDLLN